MDKITRKDLMKFSKEELAKRLQDFLTSLSPGKRARWIRINMPELLRTRVVEGESPIQLLGSIEAFRKNSVSGKYISSTDEYDHDVEDDCDSLYEWAETFEYLLRRTMKMSRQEKDEKTVECFDRLFGLLSRTRRTADILGYHGPPEDLIEVDFSEAIALYARGLLQVKDGFDEVFETIMPLAKELSYLGGYEGLVSALDSGQRKLLRKSLWKRVNSEWKESKHKTAPAEVACLVAIAEADGNKEEALSTKEQFAQANSFYLKDVLRHYEKKNDWESVAEWAKVGLTGFGQSKEYVDCLIRAKENLGDKKAVLEAKTEYFLSDGTVQEFRDLKDYAKSISAWDRALEKLLKSVGRRDKGRYVRSGLKSKLLLTEGREEEALRSATREGTKFEIDHVKLIAKYGLARVSSGFDLVDYPELKELQERCEKETGELYDWLRLAMKNEARLSRIEYAKASARMYRSLIDFHLKSGKPSRAEYAAYYCSVVKQLSDLVRDPSLWRDLIEYMMDEYRKKRLIWKHLKKRRLIDKESRGTP